MNMPSNFHNGSYRGDRSSALGFTLIELLTVIAIIGILAALAIPVTGKVRSSARRAQCASNLRQIQAAVILYVNDNRDTFPWGHDSSTNITWYEKKSPLATYVGGDMALQRLVVCPENVTNAPIPGLDPISGQWVKNDFGYPYAVNYNLMPNNSALASPPKIGAVQVPSQFILMTDSSRDADWGPGFSGFDADWKKWSRVGERHGGKSHALWCDGHVTLVKKNELEVMERIEP